jgi:uncharacterized membrane protein YoaK (UPF0700 family)
MTAAVAATVAAKDDDARLVVPLLGLTFVTGLVDAVSFLGLGHVFTANMTGNVVFIGFALGGATDLSVARSLAALASFACGGIVGGRLISGAMRAPARLLTLAMYGEVALLSAAAAAAFASGADLMLSSVYAVIVLTGIAMGLRNAVVRTLAVPDLTTTVLTLTVTGLAADSPLAGGSAPRSGRRLLAILTMAAGAFVGAMLLRRFGITVPLMMAVAAVAGLAAYQRRLYTLT